MFVEGGGTLSESGPNCQDLSQLDDEELENEIGCLASHIASATCLCLQMVAEFERRGAYEDRGFPDAVSWLAWRCSIARRTAFENLRVARALSRLPRIAAAFAKGHLSYSKVRALTRVADEQNEQELVELALEATAAQLDRIINGYRRAISGREASEIAVRRHLRVDWTPSGSLRLSGEIPGEEGALLLEALELARQSLQDSAHADADSRADLADALMVLVDQVSGARTDSNEKIYTSQRGPRESEVVVHIDLADLNESEVSSGANGEIAPAGKPLAPTVVKRLACDAAIVSVVERDGEPLSVGRRTRAIPASIARALGARDRGCRFPGCGRTRFVDAHHIVHWANGGETKLSNLVQLCRRHHRLVHEGELSVSNEDGEIIFRWPDGTSLPAAPPRSEGSVEACRQVRRAMVGDDAVDPWAIAARSRGAPFDLGWTVAGLAMRQARPVSCLGPTPSQVDPGWG